PNTPYDMPRTIPSLMPVSLPPMPASKTQATRDRRHNVAAGASFRRHWIDGQAAGSMSRPLVRNGLPDVMDADAQIAQAVRLETEQVVEGDLAGPLGAPGGDSARHGLESRSNGIGNRRARRNVGIVEQGRDGHLSLHRVGEVRVQSRLTLSTDGSGPD